MYYSYFVFRVVAAGLRPPSPNADGATMLNQQKSTAPALGDSFANQLDNGSRTKLGETFKRQQLQKQRQHLSFLICFCWVGSFRVLDD
ncbi:hypothetical protein Q3G72_012501 [Acer saccharum]|nr:hypothetical protein Q3G72_012501 [Acer saccharum]